jgi:hypothetical protein
VSWETVEHELYFQLTDLANNDYIPPIPAPGTWEKAQKRVAAEARALSNLNRGGSQGFGGASTSMRRRAASSALRRFSKRLFRRSK